MLGLQDTEHDVRESGLKAVAVVKVQVRAQPSHGVGGLADTPGSIDVREIVRGEEVSELPGGPGVVMVGVRVVLRWLRLAPPEGSEET